MRRASGSSRRTSSSRAVSSPRFSQPSRRRRSSTRCGGTGAGVTGAGPSWWSWWSWWLGPGRPRRAAARRGLSPPSLREHTSLRGALVPLEHPRVIQRIGVPAARAGVTAVAAGGVTARGGGVATLGLGLGLAAPAGLRPLAQARMHRQRRRPALLPGLRAGVGVAVALLHVAGGGVAAVTAGGLGVAAGGRVVALVDGRLVALRGAPVVLLAAAALVAPVGLSTGRLV